MIRDPATIEQVLEFNSTATSIASAETANVPEACRNGFVQVATLDLNSTFTISKGTAPSYATTNSEAPAAFSKVAYCLELKRTGSDHRRFVWVDMDAFKKRTLSACGFPSNYTRQGVATNLHVYSNDPAVHNIAADDDTQTGWIEFFPHGYGIQGGTVTANTVNLSRGWQREEGAVVFGQIDGYAKRSIYIWRGAAGNG